MKKDSISKELNKDNKIETFTGNKKLFLLKFALMLCLIMLATSQEIFVVHVAAIFALILIDSITSRCSVKEPALFPRTHGVPLWEGRPDTTERRKSSLLF